MKKKLLGVCFNLLTSEMFSKLFQKGVENENSNDSRVI